MKNALLLLLLTATSAMAHDWQWRAHRAEIEAELCQARVLARLQCDAALHAEALRRFEQIDRWIMADYHRYYRPPAIVHRPPDIVPVGPPPALPPQPGR
jgi:hypothetical protein